MQTMKLVAAFALAGVAVAGNCDAPIKVDTALSILKITQSMNTAIKALQTDVAKLKLGE